MILSHSFRFPDSRFLCNCPSTWPYISENLTKILTRLLHYKNRSELSESHFTFMMGNIVHSVRKSISAILIIPSLNFARPAKIVEFKGPVKKFSRSSTLVSILTIPSFNLTRSYWFRRVNMYLPTEQFPIITSEVSLIVGES